MLVDGPAEWAETSIPAGNKLDLLQQAYNARLGVAALPRDATVVLTRYSSDNGACSGDDDVLERVVEEVALHTDPPAAGGANSDVFRYVSWSKSLVETGSSQHHYVAIATVNRAEVWRVDLKDSLQAVLIGSHSMNCIRGVCWNPVRKILAVYNEVALDLVEVTADYRLLVTPLEISDDNLTLPRAKHCVWSPCGLSLARSSDSVVRFYSWQDNSELASCAPRSSSYRFASPSPAKLLTTEHKIGSISSTAMLSPSVFIAATDAPLALSDVKSSEPLNESGLTPQNCFAPASAAASSDNVIDLTSLRITANARSSILNVLEQPKVPLQTTAAAPNRMSHLSLIVKSTAGEWQQCVQLSLDQLAIPDVLDVEESRIVVSSTIANCVVAVHLDHSLKSGWSASVSGELELPEAHLCRGLRLTRTSPFVQVASTEKTKRTFFHASSGPQRIHLSKFKLPRRRRAVPEPLDLPVFSRKPANEPQLSQAAHDALSLVLSRMDALQTLMVTRFDEVEKRLDDVSCRLARLEVVGSSNLSDKHSE